MKKIAPFIFLSVLAFSHVFSQDTSHIAKRYNQYIGVQGNILFRQILNLSNSSVPPDNPFLLTYNINSARTGWGIRAGIGYDFVSSTQDDGVTKNISNLNDLQLRLGLEKAFRIGARWSAGIGLDFILKINNDKTTSTVTSFDTTIIVTNTRDLSYGVGPMGWLRYNISRNIQLGTESSFYYIQGETKENEDITTFTHRGFSRTITDKNSNTLSKHGEGKFSVPAVIYLIVHF